MGNTKRLLGLLLIMLCGLLLWGSAALSFAASFSDNGNGTVTDTRTGLTWQQGEPGLMTWGPALSYCEGLTLGGHSDWRLPNVKELESITDDSRHYSIDTSYFPNAHWSFYWSSTTVADLPYSAWGVDFYIGDEIFGGVYAYHNNKITGEAVRCVRGGQSGGGSVDNYDHFKITNIDGSAITDKAVNEQFQIKLTAMNANGTVKTGWSGSVNLSSTNAAISPNSKYISGGSGTVWVEISSPGSGVKINAMGGGISGASNPFNVTGAGMCTGGNVSGKVVSNKNTVSGAVVYLTGYSYSQQTTSLSDGSYAFTNVPTGEFGCAPPITMAKAGS